MAQIFVEKVSGGLRRLNRPPRYIAPHHVTGLRGSDGAREGDEPESVMGHGLHYPRKGRVDIRRITELYAADLHAIDEERAALRGRLAVLDVEERQVLNLAWQTGRNLTVAEVKAETAPATT
jgi:hypothetical protein